MHSMQGQATRRKSIKLVKLSIYVFTNAQVRAVRKLLNEEFSDNTAVR